MTDEYLLDEGGSPLIYTRGYSFDDADNRLSEANGTSNTYTVNALNQITAIYTTGQPQPHTTFDYDLNGNTTEKDVDDDVTTYEYDYENRLVEVTYSDDSSTEFVYDALGRRLKTIEKNSLGTPTGETRYVYDGLDLIAELDDYDAVIAGYTHGPGIDDPLVMRYDGDDYFYHKNHLGSITAITDIYENTVKTYTYYAFGGIRSESGSLGHNAFTYTGREYHENSGLYYYRARFYDPAIGRFITQDPIGHLGGLNLYAYVGNDSINWVDPWGLSRIVYDRTDNKIYVYPGTPETLGPPQAFAAYNRARNPNADPFLPDGYGPAPNGTFPAGPFLRTYGGPNSAYGLGLFELSCPKDRLGNEKVSEYMVEGQIEVDHGLAHWGA